MPSLYSYLSLALLAATSTATSIAQKCNCTCENVDCSRVDNWLYSSDLEDAKPYLNRSDILGVQILYSWNSLEPAKDEYDFSQIQSDLKYVNSIGKKLWVQLQDRSFYLPNNPVPKYVRGQAQFANGSVIQCDGDNCAADFVPGGWTASQWNANLRERFQALLAALAKEFDEQLYGLNLPETAIEVNESQFGFSAEAYVNGTLENAKYARSVFNRTKVVQYVNFWPDEDNNDHGYMGKAFGFFALHDIGVGGPDDIPFKPGQENNSYPFLSAYRKKVPISVIAVQEPDLKEINPDTGKPFTKDEFTSFAVGCLGSDIIFWALSTPWLN